MASVMVGVDASQGSVEALRRAHASCSVLVARPSTVR